MSEPTAPADLLRIPLRGLRPAFEFGADGFHHAAGPRGAQEVISAYADLLHVEVTAQALWIATRRDVHPIPRAHFDDPADAQRVLRLLRERVARLPDGAERIARMRELDRIALRPPRAPATRGLTVMCLVGYALPFALGVDAYLVGFFDLELVRAGEWWRAITGNLLHASIPHLLMNLLGLHWLGRHVERLLGTRRFVCVAIASGVLAMLGSGLLIGGEVVGVSGVVLGLAGALLWLQLFRRELIPAVLRMPRRGLQIFGLALAFDLGLGFRIPWIAAEAHLLGFASGFASALLVAPRDSLGRTPAPALRAASTLLAAGAVAALVAAGSEIARGNYVIRHSDRLLAASELPAGLLNNIAWQVAIDEDSDPEALRSALRLAERAVEQAEADQQEQREALIDTLAELQFLLGDAEQAVRTIERAIELAPDEDYYREQRRRFLGERAADDRPADPALRGAPQAPAPPPEREAPPMAPAQDPETFRV